MKHALFILALAVLGGCASVAYTPYLPTVVWNTPLPPEPLPPPEPEPVF